MSTPEEQEEIDMLKRLSEEFFKRLMEASDVIDYINAFVLSVVTLYDEREEQGFKDGIDLAIACMIHAEKFAQFQARQRN